MPFNEAASIISLCKCTLENSSAPLNLFCFETNKFILSARDSADLNKKGDSLNISKPTSYIASLAPKEEILLSLA
ncbi:hypothetical protein [Escherichia albertii]|uniref:hypothetical protein n=1 Tax=Escherichia albertii TaxID=208962 RepID=UPI003872BD2C